MVGSKGIDQEFIFGHIKFEIPIRHPNGDVLGSRLYKPAVLGRVHNWKYKCGNYQEKRGGPRTEI